LDRIKGINDVLRCLEGVEVPEAGEEGKYMDRFVEYRFNY